MRTYFRSTLVFAVVATIALQSCKKENGIDNNAVIEKPYGLYVSDDQGQLMNTNDGTNYKTIFPPDGYRSRALITSGENIIWVKKNVHLSTDNGKNFNPTYNKIQSFYLNLLPYLPWQQIIIDVPDHKRVYIGSTEGQGIAYSIDNGKTWSVDNDWDTATIGGNITSFTQLRNGALFAHSVLNDSLYKKDNATDKWTWVNQITQLPNTGVFYISHFNNTLLATDISGANGVYASNDFGVNWVQYTGLPTTHILYTTAAPFDETLLVGTDSLGIYRFEEAVKLFIPSNAGLGTNTVVYSIVGKDNLYKNGIAKKYIYIATNKGLFRSEDLGRNWSLVKSGSYVGLY